jgi:acyl-coenzyme A thioesterase PaaI-like protein
MSEKKLDEIEAGRDGSDAEGRQGGELALQVRYSPAGACFGCGPANPKGLRLQSYVGPDGVVATFQPEPHHEAFPGVLNGGIIGALLDCHSNWTAAHALMLARGEASPPCTVTAEFHVKLRHPTPTDLPVTLTARPMHTSGGPRPDRCTVDAELSSGGKVMATCRGVFVAVNESHPAYHRW